MKPIGGFGLGAFKKFPELIPLVTIISSALAMGTGFMGYALITKPDVRVSKRVAEAPYERVEPQERRKLFIRNPDNYKPIPELEKLRKEIGSYKC